MKIDYRYSASPIDVRAYSTAQLRRTFMLQKLFEQDKCGFVMLDGDRMLIGGAMPVNKPVSVEEAIELGSDFLLQHREAGIINIGGRGKITVDGVGYELSNRDGLYVGMGAEELYFESDMSGNPAKFFICSTLAGKCFPTRAISFAEQSPRSAGTADDCSHCAVYPYITPDEIDASRLNMGLTVMEAGSCWSNLPPHTHCTSTEAALYFNMKPGNAVFHIIGEPSETRHLVLHNEQGAFAPGWSVHSAVGTSGYSFIWCSSGESRDTELKVRADILELM